MAQLGDRYRILSQLGAGGMGEVFLAEDPRLERRVAVKVLPASSAEDRLARERLRREALAAASLDHPFICKVHEIGDADGRMWCAFWSRPFCIGMGRGSRQRPILRSAHAAAQCSKPR